ncbi:MAG: hypothetical protein V1649_04305 [Patescibacteria group bacterium]
MKFYSRLFLISVIILANIVFVFPRAEGKTSSYYTGDAINYKKNIYIGSANMGGAEIFKFDGKTLARVAYFKSPVAQSSNGDDFYNIVFNEEAGMLYAYLVDGQWLYKYNITNQAIPILVEKEKDNSWDWFVDIIKYDGKIATLGTKGVKIWNNNLEVIDSYKVVNHLYYNIQFSHGVNRIFQLDSKVLNIIDANKKEIIKKIDLQISKEHRRHLFLDNTEGMFFVVDDKELLKFDYSGKFINKFKHTSKLGYDVDGLENGNHIYFSDGIGVVKIDKNSLKPMKWVYTNNKGDWAMGLRVVPSDSGEKIIIFNNSNILILNKDLTKISSIKL